MTEFAETLKAVMKRRGIGGRELARVSGTSQGSVWKATAGGAPPLAHLPKWAAVLGLNGDERESFLESGRSAKAAGKKDIAPYVQELEGRVDALEAVATKLIAMLRDQGVEVPENLLKLLDAPAE